ncbi:MAG: hypothetical protein RLZ75_2637 [Pseudomonadota bacterium]|jgi:hypothetical protein
MSEVFEYKSCIQNNPQNIFQGNLSLFKLSTAYQCLDLHEGI